MLEGACGVASCITGTAVLAVIGGLMTVWMLGFGMGKTVAYLRAFRGAA